jgi:hypothetical protein
MDEQEIGIKRLARVIAASFIIQDINDRDVQAITENIFGAGINKDTVCRLRNAGTRNPKEGTLQRLAPLLFRVAFFKLSGDGVGIPVLEFGDPYDFDKSMTVKLARSVTSLPDRSYRYSSWKELDRIIDGDVAIKRYSSRY